MRKTLASRLKNPPLPLAVLAGLLLVAAKLFLCSAQQVLLQPDIAVLDDMVMYDAAVSITGGGWLGTYTWTTLAKHSFFAVWLAGLHAAGIPYLLGGQLLWAAASLAAAWALAPLFKNRWVHLGLFCALLFIPSSTANPAPMGYVTRVYRDNIFPALCVLCVAGMVGFALRCTGPVRRSVGWPVLAGVAFAAAWLCREDGWWLIFFVVAAAVAAAFAILRAQAGTARQKLLRCACLLLVFVLLAAGVLSWGGVNNAVYGQFVVSDFTTGAFADAYGAMTRIEHEHWDPKVAVPREVREKLYALVPAFAQLEPLLEEGSILNDYAGGEEYDSGSFYWALRRAAAEAGYYDSPEKAEAYFAHLAAEINALCDEGVLAATSRRSSVNPPIKAAYVGPVLAEGFYSLGFCAVFAQCDARSIFSDRGNNPLHYEEYLRPMEEYLHEKALVATIENSDAPYYTPLQKLQYLALDIIRYAYRVLLPCALLCALAWLVWEGARLLGVRRRQRMGQRGLVWLVALGLLLCAMLRAFMIAFVMVSQFHISTYVMYLASIHPLLLLFGFLGTARLVQQLWAHRKAKGEAAHGLAEAAG